MNKVLVVARNEYLIAITSKAFLIGLIMMPVFMGGAIVVQYLTRDQVDLTPRKVAVVDRSGDLAETLASRADHYNENVVYEGEGDERKQTRPEFVIEAIEAGGKTDKEIQSEQSDRVREGDVFAFVIIEPKIMDPAAGATVQYYSQSPSYRDLPGWIERVVNEEVKKARIKDLGIPQESVVALAAQTPLRQFGLVDKTEDGGTGDAKEENEIMTFAIPFGGLMLMFVMVMSVAPAMLNNVLEEKIQKISEFLVSSITPFQLMLGKLVGAVAVGMTLAVVYLGAVYGLLSRYGFASEVPISMYFWFIFYLLIALIIFGSIFSAIGAACSEIRDAQSLMTPVMLLVIIPMMCFGPVLSSPSSTFAKLISLFPPATPMLMFLRIAIPPGPAAWEIVVGTVLVVLFAGACVWAAGKIFRVGVLSQGQAPTFGKLIKWIVTK